LNFPLDASFSSDLQYCGGMYRISSKMKEEAGQVRRLTSILFCSTTCFHRLLRLFLLTEELNGLPWRKLSRDH